MYLVARSYECILPRDALKEEFAMIEYMGLLSHDEWRDWRLAELRRYETDTRLPKKQKEERKGR